MATAKLSKIGRISMELKEYSIINRVRDVPGIPTQTLEVPDFDRMYYTVKIGSNRFVDVMCITDYIEHNQYAYVMDTGCGSIVYGLIKAGEEQYYYDDVLPESQEKFLIDMVIKAYNKEFQYEAPS